MNTVAKGQMVPRICSVNNKFVGLRNRIYVAISGDVPHDHFITGPDGLTPKLHIGERRPAHVGHRRLPANDLWDHFRNQIRVGTKLCVLRGVLIQCQNATGD